MPRTRTDLDRRAKVAEILDAADAQLDRGGFDGLSMVAIARTLGVAQNSIYWYFPSRDALFVAALERRVRSIFARKPKETARLVDKIIWLVDQLHRIYPLWASMRQRAQQSEEVARFAAALERVLREMLANALRPYVPPEELDAAVDLLVVTVEGAFVQGLSRPARRNLLTFTLDRLSPALRDAPADDLR